ncbi:MAG: type II toxin-antitoxin system HipA family toxin [Burkholderiaceae bacterium]
MTESTALPERIPLLDVSIAGAASGQLLKRSTYEFRYLDPRADQPALALLMPAARQLTWQGGELFPVMDQILPEGDLFMRLRALYPKQPLTPMHLLALIGMNGIGRIGYRMPTTQASGRTPPAAPPLSKQTLLRTAYSPQVFDELVRAYLSTGVGIAGMQPKIMVPERATIPVPTLIVKVASDAYPDLSANEYLCLAAARRAGIDTARAELSDDGQMLIVDRFDLVEADGQVERLGFEDIAALAGLRVRDVLSDRKYQGSYQRVAELIRQLQLPRGELHRFYEQLAFSAMVRNGDGHLKNFGLLYRSHTDARLAPMFDVVTTAIYRHARYPGGPAQADHTMALKLFASRHGSRSYPLRDELLRFGSSVCEVSRPALVVERIAAAMRETLTEAAGDDRIPARLLNELTPAWQDGMRLAAS